MKGWVVYEEGCENPLKYQRFIVYQNKQEAYDDVGTALGAKTRLLRVEVQLR